MLGPFLYIELRKYDCASIFVIKIVILLRLMT